LFELNEEGDQRLQKLLWTDSEDKDSQLETALLGKARDGATLGGLLEVGKTFTDVFSVVRKIKSLAGKGYFIDTKEAQS